MIQRAFVFAAALLVATAGTSVAQPKEPIGRFVADVRATSTGLPIVEGWTPVVPTGTEVPSRALGFEAGAHVFVARFGSGALGIGATWMSARGSTSPPEPASDVTPPPVNTIPDVTTKVTALTPQLSLNFGHSLGWSYVSAGLGRARVESRAALTSGPATTIFAPRESGWVQSINFGGGARWLINDHVGFGFDVRWHKLAAIDAAATGPGAPRTSLLVIGAGLVLK